MDRLFHSFWKLCLGRSFVFCFGSFLSLFTAVVAEEADPSLLPKGPLGTIWEAQISGSSAGPNEVEALIRQYEKAVGIQIAPGDRGKVGLKLNTRSGDGLSTPKALVSAVVESLVARGYQTSDILLVDGSAFDLRAAGYLSPLSSGNSYFEGMEAIALDDLSSTNQDWFYDSPLPPVLQQQSRFAFGSQNNGSLLQSDEARKSFLPAALIFDVDFWINLPVIVDDPSLGIDGALANATLWNVTNNRRFLLNDATASAAVAEIAAIPELEERLLFHLVSFEKFQFISGPRFNALYTREEPRIWLSSDAVAIDRLSFDRLNAIRILEGFPEIKAVPQQITFAESLGLGFSDPRRIRVINTEVENDSRKSDPLKPEAIEPESKDSNQATDREAEQSRSWLRRLRPW